MYGTQLLAYLTSLDPYRKFFTGHGNHTLLALFTGNSPLTAKMFMVAVDQIIVNMQLPSFTKALQMMFCSYYVHNVDYPVELAVTLEFLQRYVFSMHYTLR